MFSTKRKLFWFCIWFGFVSFRILLAKVSVRISCVRVKWSFNYIQITFLSKQFPKPHSSHNWFKQTTEWGKRKTIFANQYWNMIWCSFFINQKCVVGVAWVWSNGDSRYIQISVQSTQHKSLGEFQQSAEFLVSRTKMCFEFLCKFFPCFVLLKNNNFAWISFVRHTKARDIRTKLFVKCESIADISCRRREEKNLLRDSRREWNGCIHYCQL